jgi:short-subunit dehydrogenase
MRARREGKMLITGSIAGFMPGTYQAVYNGSKAFLDSFSFALRHEIKESGVTVTCLMPGATETEFFARADMLDTAAWPMAALDVKVTRMSGSVAFRWGRCREGLTRHYRAERPSDHRSTSQGSAGSRG